MNNKGFIDSIFMIIIFIVVVIVLVMMSFLWSKLNTALNDEPQFQTNETQQLFSDASKSYHNFDITMFFLFIGFAIILLITSYLIRTNPVFTTIMIILLILVMLVSLLVNVIWDGVATSNAELQNEIETNFPRANFILNNIALLFFIIDCMAFMVLFGKRTEVV